MHQNQAQFDCPFTKHGIWFEMRYAIFEKFDGHLPSTFLTSVFMKTNDTIYRWSAVHWQSIVGRYHCVDVYVSVSVCIQYVESWLFFTICIYIFLEISSCIKVKPVIVALKHNKSGQMFILHIRICFSPLSVSAVKLKLIRNLLPLWKQNMLDNDKNYLSF